MDASLLHYPGSLLTDDTVVASWDIEQGARYPRPEPLRIEGIFNLAIADALPAYADHYSVNFINGMGVTLGDSIVGLNVCHYLKHRWRDLHIHILRPSRSPQAVEVLYRRALAAGIVDSLSSMPWPLAHRIRFDINIDMGNQLYRDSFRHLPMHDYFYQQAGINPASVPLEWKQNRWLAGAPREVSDSYVLFCPQASTPLRQIPARFHEAIVRDLQRRFDLPVKGFAPLTMSGYQNISAAVTTTDAYIEVIRMASYVYTADSAALHIAAGLGVPAHVVFTTIDPALRVRYYPNVTWQWIGDERLEGIHASEDPELLAHLEMKFAALYG